MHRFFPRVSCFFVGGEKNIDGAFSVFSRQIMHVRMRRGKKNASVGQQQITTRHENEPNRIFVRT